MQPAIHPKSIRHHLLPLILGILLLTNLPSLWGQANPWDSWDPEVLAALHTAIETDYLTDEEKKVILFMNMARTNGPLFAETFVETYIVERNLDRSKYVRSLIRDLNKTRDLPLIHPAGDLQSVAIAHATDMGESGKTGHQGFKNRMEPLLGPYRYVGENCSYGLDQAVDIVISLLIDEGIEDVGHRTNTLRTDFNAAGVAIRPHKRYRTNCVIDFGSRAGGDLNAPPL